MAPAPNNPNPYNTSYPHSAIYWDGKINGNYVSDGVYFWTLTLRGCQNEGNYAGFIHVFGSSFTEETDEHSGGDEEGSGETRRQETFSGNQIVNTFLYTYPNPADDNLNFSLVGAAPEQNYTVEIVNSAGQLVYSSVVTGENGAIDIRDLAPGLYTLKTIYNNERYTSNFIKN